MAELGSLAMLLALALAVYSAVGSVVGLRKGIPELVQSARYATYLIVLVLGVATASLVVAFLRHDFQIAYVAEHSNLAMKTAYIWVALYAGNEGSLLFIAFALSVLSALAVALAPRSVRETLPYTNAILILVLIFFLALMVSVANPFAQLAFAPLDGRGINPLLTHPGMFIHPPVMMTGLVGVTVPFAFAMSGLMAGKTGDEWVDAGRAWGLVAWALLGTGLLLGAWWAYTILGWGGYWGWDPVENSGLMPWLALTAFVHSIMVQKQRRMFRMWNIVLVILAFGLAQFGMFLNRGGPVPSIHSFGQSTLGWIFLLFMAITMVAAFSLFFARYSSLKSAQSLESTLSREAAFLVNNLLFLAVAFVTFWGVVFPLVSDVFQGVRVTVATPFYNQVNGPLLLALIFLMGVGPLLPWRRASLVNLRKSLLLPGLMAMALVVLLLVVGLRNPYATLSFGLCTVVAVGILQEWVRGTRSRHKKGENYVLSFTRLIASNRRRYGGYIVHLAVVLLALGITGSSFYNLQSNVILAPGESTTVGEFDIEYIGSEDTEKPDRTESVSFLRVHKNGALLGTLTAWRTFYPEWRMASTRAAIRSTPVEDLYIIPSEFLGDGRAGFRVLINPLVMWMWVAGPVLILGTMVALWPQARRVRPFVEKPEEVTVTAHHPPRSEGEGGD